MHVIGQTAPDRLGLGVPATAEPFEMNRRRLPTGQRCEQAVPCGVQARALVAHAGRFSEGLLEERFECGDPPDQIAPNRTRRRQLGVRKGERAGKPFGDFGGKRGELTGEAARRASEIGAGHHEGGADDAEADLTGARDREDDDVAGCTADRAQFVACDDRRRVARERGRIRCEAGQNRRHHGARDTPERKAQQAAGTALNEQRGQHHDGHGADHRADHAEPALA